MAIALHKPSKTLHSGIGPADLVPAEDWIIDPVIPFGADLPWIVVEGETIRAMTDEEREAAQPETMAERHAREQREGVDVMHVGYVKYDRATRELWQGLLSLVSRRGNDLPGVQVWNAAGTLVGLSVAQANEAIDDYILKASQQVMRQLSECGNG